MSGPNYAYVAPDEGSSVCAIALTYNIQRNATSVIFQAEKDHTYQEKFVAYIKERQELAVGHPAFALLVAAQMEYERVERSKALLSDQLKDIDSMTDNMMRFLSDDKDAANPENLPNITEGVQRVGETTMDEIGLVKRNLMFYEQISRFMDQVRRLNSEDAAKTCAMNDAELQQHLEFLANRFRTLLVASEALEKTIQMYLPLVGGAPLRT